MTSRFSGEDRLFDRAGQRKYLHAAEARRVLAVAAHADPRTRLFCEVLYYTGCRISEALQLTPRRVDLIDRCVIFRTLKRRRLVYRAVPVPTRLMRALVAVGGGELDAPLFPWSRQRGWRCIKALMEAADIFGPQATPRGFRHHYGVNAIASKIPEGKLREWMGHAKLENTLIYTHAIGPEERALAQRMWRKA